MQRRTDNSTSLVGRRLADRYAIGEQIDSGGISAVYRGKDAESGGTVAVKELALERVEDWKTVELFERQADVLQRLDHPGVPDYIDAFSVEDEATDTVRHYLVQEFIEGENLDSVLREGETFGEHEIRRFLGSLLEILAYLHDRKPPVVHRDVTPAKIIRRRDGDWSLVGFGVVQQVWADTVGGSTFVGTSGYMPPEQAAGRATPASDIYALGATTLELLSGRPPGDFQTSRMKVRFRGRLDISDSLADFLDRMLAPVPEDRFADGSEALSELRRLPEDDEERGLPMQTPGAALVSGSSVHRQITPSGNLQLRVPVDGWIKHQRVNKAIYRFGVPIAILILALGFTVSLLIAGQYGSAVISGLISVALLSALGPKGLDRELQLAIDPDGFRVTRVRGWPGSSRHTTETLYGETSSLKKALAKRIEYGDSTPSVDEYLPGADALDWLIVERLETSEVRALSHAISGLEEE